MKSHIRVIGRKNLFDGQFLTFSEVTLKLLNGKTKKHYNVERVPTVAVFPITDNYDIYLISQYRYIHDKVMLEAVAGTIDKGEKPIATAKRELREEAGIEANTWKKLGSSDLAASYVKAKVFLFLAKGLKLGDHHQEEDEQIVLTKMSLEEAVKKVMHGEITTASSIIGILMLDRLRREKKL